MNRRRWALPALLVLLATVSITAAEDRGAVTAGGGVFSPYGDPVGGMAVLGAEGRVSQHVSVGGELEYNHLGGSGGASLENITTRGLVRYTWLPGAVHPYVGAGAGVGVHVLHGSDIPGWVTSAVAATGPSIGILGLAGLDVPVSQQVSLFAEGRISGDFGVGSLAGSQLGGVAGTSGARIHF